MSRVAGSYASVVLGVSEQVPQDRRPGQNFEQVNMISDPVRGLARRHGSLHLQEKIRRDYTPEAYSAMLADTANHKVFPFRSNDRDYDLIYRTTASAGQVPEDGLLCFDKALGAFVDVVLLPTADLTTLLAGGVSALANVGTYLLLAGKDNRSTLSAVDTLAATNNVFAAWVRGGAYARKYTIKLGMFDGSTREWTYTTPTTSYPGVLDTSAILATDTAYTKKVGDITNAYNTALTQWIGTSAAAIVPSAIATQLAALITASGGGLTATVVDSTVMIVGGTGANKLLTITCDDHGDGTLFRGVGNDVPAAELVSAVHYIGKVIQVRPKRNDGTDVYYLKALSAGPIAAGNYGKVTWRECAGYESTPTGVFCIAKIHTDGKLYVGGDATVLQTAVGGAVPRPTANGVGDRNSSPVPAFIGKRIDYLGVFQDRLVVGAGAVLFFSRTGDYQNFWRQSVLTVDPADPIEMFALGAEADTIRASCTYDRNLLLFGLRKQYVVSGRQPLTPSNASIVTQSSHEGAVDAPPINSGNYVFYSTHRNGVSSAHQIQMGLLVDSPESFTVSKQLDTYLKGKPVELLSVASPNMVFLRTSAARDRVYTYTYLDTAGATERLFDSWSTWQWNADMGALMGLSRHEGDVIMYFMRRGKGPTDTVEKLYISAEKFVVDSTLSKRPYLDSLRLETSVTTGSIGSGTTGIEEVSVAIDSTVPEYMLGTTFELRAAFEQFRPETVPARWVGWNYPAFVTPTNPFILDGNGKAIVNGRLTVTSANVSVADTGGLRATISTRNGEHPATDFTGRVIGQATNLVGRQPIVTTAVSVPMGREVRDFKYTLHARRWLPMTITAIEWRGQFFNNIRRV